MRMRFAKAHSPNQEDTRKVKTQTTRQTVEVRADGEGLVSHAGAYLLTELADRLGLTTALSEAMAPSRERRSAHDPGVVLRDLAVSIADGGDCVSDLGVLAGQEALFGPVASQSTAHRVIKSIDEALLEAIRTARARARERAWEAETGKPLAGLLRPGNAGSNTAADHFEVLQGALEQLPEPDLQGEILVRADSGGKTKAFAADCRDAGIRFSLGYELRDRAREAIVALPRSAWRQAIDAEGKAREGAQVAELTEAIDLSTWPEGTRLIVRRERPHPGAQFCVFDDAHGYRHTAFITDQADSDIATLELRHRRRARVEDAIRCGKETGMRALPFAAFGHNRAWFELSLIAQDLLRWTGALCLSGELRLAEPKRIRQRLLHVAGRLVRSGRRTSLRLPRSWPWADALTAAFTQLRALPAGAIP